MTTEETKAAERAAILKSFACGASISDVAYWYNPAGWSHDQLKELYLEVYPEWTGDWADVAAGPRIDSIVVPHADGIAFFERNHQLDTFCLDCAQLGLRERQVQTPSGASCKYGHDGAEGVPDPDIDSWPEFSASAVPAPPPMPEIELDETQKLAVDLIRKEPIGIITGGAGCHRAGQAILMADGTVRAVETVVVGDRLAGFSGPRTVLELRSGSSQMVRVIPRKGAAFVVNRDHVLTVVDSASNRVVDVAIPAFCDWSAKRRREAKLFRASWDPQCVPRDLEMPAYCLGVLLGDGALGKTPRFYTPNEEIVEALRGDYGIEVRRVSSGGGSCPAWSLPGFGRFLRALNLLGCTAGTKFIPDHYLLHPDAEVRRQLLAGLLDTDGYLCWSGTFDYISKSERLADAVVYLSRSLGLAAYVSPSEKYCQTGAGGIYYRVSISGDLDQIPNRVSRKKAKPRRQKKNPLRTGFDLEFLPEEEQFFGFTLDGDGRYLLGDFTVTHNTGKTTTLRAALLEMEKLEKKPTVALCAPTGKAARRIREATGYSAQTIHRLLGWEPGEGMWAHNAGNALPYDVVVVDEASMLDTELAAGLFDAISPQRSRIILTGDVNQLPSVGPGKVFGDLIDSGHVPVVRLEQVHRQAQKSWVYRNAPRILAGEELELDGSFDDFTFYECSDEEQLTELLVDIYGTEVNRVAELHTGSDAAELALDAVQMLIPQKTGNLGCEIMNARIQRAIHGDLEQGDAFTVHKGLMLSDGDKIIQTKNNYTLGVMNGETGVVMGHTQDSLEVQVDENTVRYGRGEALDLQLGYAITIHKMQGSQADTIVMLCSSQHSRMLTRQLFYTGVTRAAKRLVLVGDRPAITRALRIGTVAQRETRLIDRINYVLEG